MVFRKGKSTVDAINTVVESARITKRGNHYLRPACLLVTLDVKNAFNSAKWSDILDALQLKFRIPRDLLRMIRHYLRDRTLRYDTISVGVAKGSILRPDL